jgi:hypothetical protein
VHRRFLGVVIPEGQDSWRVRLRIAKENPWVFAGCVAAFAVLVVVVEIVA